ncbi:MAG: DUF3299 domain-containing protein [Pseudomonadota bacterium]|nr:hypothetical protein [Alphaproteobacteria bacterium]MEC7701778.1 DUF3299 domain-containing protein [Pseudomonadota bacterium]|tara:strand:- start:9398 stop:9955 length:558 start_codon:yes stop_codon:yes gene_type:complete
MAPKSKDPSHPLSHTKMSDTGTFITKAFGYETTPIESTAQYTQEEIIESIDEFVTIPEGGTEWAVFGRTAQIPYSYEDADGIEWSGVRPEFTDELKALDGQDIIIQGFLFPIGEQDGKALFLLGPFPLSCPFHYHVKPNLIIEVHTEGAIEFQYDPVNLSGKLELVYKDDEYNVFYRLRGATIVK